MAVHSFLGLHRVNLDQMQICPEFSNFLFTDWNPDEVVRHREDFFLY